MLTQEGIGVGLKRQCEIKKSLDMSASVRLFGAV